MTERLWRSLAVVSAAACLTAAVAAEPPDRADTKATAIRVSAWTADNTAIGGAKLRLRNVVTGKAEATAVANDRGEFVFENAPAGSYAVELLSSTGHVQVVGQVFTIVPGQTVATVVRTGTKVPWFMGFFSNTAAAAADTAASVGVTAITPAAARPVSRNQ